MQAFLFGDCWVIFSYTLSGSYHVSWDQRMSPSPPPSCVIRDSASLLLSRTLFCSLSGSLFFFESKIAHAWSKCVHFHYRLSLWKGIYVESDILHFRLDHGLVLSKPIMRVKRSSLWRRANARNVSFITRYGGQKKRKGNCSTSSARLLCLQRVINLLYLFHPVYLQNLTFHLLRL